MALAFPAAVSGDAGAPVGVVMSDFSTTMMARSKAVALANAGEMTPEPMFLEADGNPSCDPSSLIERDGTPMLMGTFAIIIVQQSFRKFKPKLWF